MSGLRIRRATMADLGEVLRLVHDAADWLHARGLDQWPHDSPSLSPDAISSYIAAGQTLLVHAPEGGRPVATVSASPAADPDFWDAPEMMRPAWYVSKLAVDRTRACKGLGAMLMRWVADRAARDGIPLLRLDVWKTNLALQDWYLSQGWSHLRTVDLPWRHSGALFQRVSGEDLEAREFFAAEVDA